MLQSYSQASKSSFSSSRELRRAIPSAFSQGPLRADGSGLNPLLQYPEMVIHPPMLYLGYVGFTVPFAFALGALIMKYPGEKWIHITRRWTMVTWGFLTCGIFLGAHWAYAVLGWGGYWGWDPVENASLMPWLVGTAFLHSVMMQEKRGMLKVWNMWLVFFTFWLAILGNIPHPQRHDQFRPRLRAIVNRQPGLRGSSRITFAVFVFFFAKNHSHLRSEHKLESLISRESSFLFNNLLFVSALLHRGSGARGSPRFQNWCKATKSQLARRSITASLSRLRLLLLILTAVGPLLAWRKTSSRKSEAEFHVARPLAPSPSWPSS